MNLPQLLLIIVLYLLSLSSDVAAQKIVIENLRENTLIAGIDNYVAIAVENVPSSQLVIKTDNGFFKKTYDTGNFILVPMTIFPCIIEVYRENSNRLVYLGEKKFRVKEYMPKPYATLDYFKSKMTVGELLMNKGVSIYVDGFDWDAETIFIIEKYTVEIYNSIGEQLAIFTNEGKIFHPDVISLFKQLQVNSKIRFRDIFIRTNNDYQMQLIDMKEIIVE